MNPNALLVDCLKIGSILKASGLNGEVLCELSDPDFEDIFKSPVFLLIEGKPVPFFIAADGLSGRGGLHYTVKFDYIDSREEAAEITGCDIYVKKTGGNENVDIYDVVGFEVRDEERNISGLLEAVEDYSGNILLLVAFGTHRVLLPFSEVYVREILPEDRILFVHIPDDIFLLNC